MSAELALVIFVLAFAPVSCRCSETYQKNLTRVLLPLRIHRIPSQNDGFASVCGVPAFAYQINKNILHKNLRGGNLLF